MRKLAPELVLEVKARCKALYCIGTTAKGSPRHPSRAEYTSNPVLWWSLAEESA